MVEKFENKKNSESTAVDYLLDLKDVVLTLDALHCKKTLNKIVAKGNHYM